MIGGSVVEWLVLLTLGRKVPGWIPSIGTLFFFPEQENLLLLIHSTQMYTSTLLKGQHWILYYASIRVLKMFVILYAP